MTKKPRGTCVAAAIFLAGLATLALSPSSSSSSSSSIVSLSELTGTFRAVLSSSAHSTGTIHAGSLGGSGFNNQRQVLMFHTWAARELGWNLVLPRSFQAKRLHGSPALAIEEVYDVDAIRQYVGGKVGFHDINEKNDGGEAIKVRINVNPLTCSGNLTGDLLRSAVGEAVARKRRARRTSGVVGPELELVRLEFPNIRFFNADPAFPNDEYGRSSARNLFSAFRFADNISKCADLAAKDVLAKRCPKGVHATHLRVGDRSPNPLFDCSRGVGILGKNLEERGPEAGKEARHTTFNCRDASSGKDVTIGDVFASELPPARDGTKSSLGEGQCVYVATNGPKSGPMGKFRDWAKREGQGGGNGLEVLTYEDVVLRSGGAMPECRQGGVRAIVDPSLFEQALLSRIAGRYVPTFPSSWDEYVLYTRLQREVAMGEKMFKAREDLDLFHEKANRLHEAHKNEVLRGGGDAWCLRVLEDEAATASAIK